MKKILFLVFSLITAFVQGQSLPATTIGEVADQVFRQQPNSPGLSPRHYRNEDSTKLAVIAQVGGRNLLDKSLIVPGQYSNVNGFFATPSFNGRRSGFIRVKPGTTYTVSGINVNFVGNQYDSLLTVSSPLSTAGGVFTSYTFTTLPTTAYVGLNINANAVFGTDNTAMLNEGATAVGYESFLPTAVKGEFVTGRIAGVMYEKDYATVGTNLIDPAGLVSGSYYGFSSNTITTASGWVRTGLIPVRPHTIYTLSGVNTTFVGSEFTSAGQSSRIRVLSQSGTLVNVISFRTSSTAAYVGLNIQSVGQTASAATAQLELGGRTAYAAYTATGVAGATGSSSSLPNLFVSYSPPGGAQATFTVYCRYAPGSTYYVGYILKRYVNTTERADMYRIMGADLYQYLGGSMIASGVNLLTNGESENVWKAVGKSDFTGGVHGDESLTSVSFYLNSVALSASDLTVGFSLKPASDFWYIQTSTMIETDNATLTPMATHQKRTDFVVGGYKTFNRLTWLASPNVDVWYSGIACVAISQADVAYDEDFTNYVLDRSKTSGTRIINKQGGRRQIDYYSAANNMGVSVSSQILKPSAQDVNAKLELWDVPDYAKYYRGLYAQTPAIGDVWESLQTVRHYKN
ncbi:hypothetical protein [Spirosoma fluviale]|uniref:Uncharacterized protein n=1 Tax=Spirosoma fluviale TaxID=1597977 RepID=A0A286FCX7_9BACT|nr:hypothetical protein [Spirosoma fluviale]SOD81043.1 hypothetical protein SAMN06269250_1655 [Spirosoma fluviale]